MDKRDQCDHEAVVSKRSQRRFIQELQEPEYRNIGHDKSDNKADKDHDHVIAVQVGKAFQQVVKTSNHHDRHGNDKRKIRCRLAAEP